MATRPVTTWDVLDGHVTLDLQCLDRIYLNGYLPNLQVGGQIVRFLAGQGFPIPSPAVVARIGDRFRDAVRRLADTEHIPVVRFAKHARKLDVMRPHLDRQAATGRSGIAGIGVAQEFQWVASSSTRPARGAGAPHFEWGRAERRVSCFYFYLWDEEFGPAFVKVCSYLPYPIKICLLTELPGGSPLVMGRMRVRVVMVPPCDRNQRTGTGFERVVGSSAGFSGGQRGSVRALSAA